MEVAAINGANFRLDAGESIAKRVERYARMFFDPDFEPMVTCKTPGEGQDILASSANNFYDGVTMADLEGFEEKNQINARLAKRDGVLVEEVYKVGGLYGCELTNIVSHLRAAIAFAPEPFANALQALIKWYETGLDSDREAFDIAWVQNRDSAVDTMNGFIEVYLDARGMKGAWEGVVYYANHEKTDKIRALAANAQWFEDHLPIDPKYRKPVVQGVSAQAIEVVVESGDAGPITPIGVNLPNDQRIREQFGSKSVTLSNVLDAYERSMPDSFRQEFAWDDAEVERAKRWGAFAGELTTEIHEVLGHGSGRMADHVTVTPQELLKEQYSALEETRRRPGGVVFRGRPAPCRARPGAARRTAGRGADRIRGLRAQRPGAVAARSRRCAARGRSHAQPPGDRSLAAREHQSNRRPSPRRQNVLCRRRHRRVP